MRLGGESVAERRLFNLVHDVNTRVFDRSNDRSLHCYSWFQETPTESRSLWTTVGCPHFFRLSRDCHDHCRYHDRLSDKSSRYSQADQFLGNILSRCLDCSERAARFPSNISTSRFCEVADLVAQRFGTSSQPAPIVSSPIFYCITSCIVSISTFATSGRVNSAGGISPFLKSSLTLVPLRMRW